MRAYSLMGFLNKPTHTIIENEEDFAFEYKNLITTKSLEEGKLISNIKIPLIQRDYAQGRKSNLNLRNQFLKHIFYHLNEDKELKLDFIYGSLEKVNNEISFLPLDGQQRLTTLFLLYWYVIKKEGHQEENREELESLLTKFTYETRDTSRRFFSNLAEFNFVGNPKEEIEKAYWFSNYFKLDPTVSAVLNTLESIHTLYNEADCKGNLLKKLDKIVFYVLPMDQFRLTDDLYIKLNARGKVLSSFENFKADIIGFMKKYKKYEEEREFLGMKLYHHDILSNKLDNKWADFFWQKAKDDEGKKSIDGYFFKFIHKVLINEYIVAFNQKDLLKDEVYNSLLTREEKLNYSTFDFYKQRIFINIINKIEILLDFYAEHSFEIFNNIQPKWNPDFKWDIFKVEYTMDDRMLFYAVNHYALNNREFNLEHFKDWIRVVWNIIIDPDIRSIGANKTAMTYVRSISKYSDDILLNLDSGHLDSYLNDSRNIHSLQLREEKRKASLLNDNDKWRNSIYKSESNLMLQGNISMLLEVSNTSDELDKFYNKFQILFSTNKPHELIAEENHTLMRYVVASFTEWNLLENFNFSSNTINWKTYVRRNLNVKSSIQKLLIKDSKEDIAQLIKSTIRQSSIISTQDIRHNIVHKHLYIDNLFHNWMQDDGVNKIKWLDHHYFVIRPSAWYSKVMIDNFRNEIIQEVINELNISELNNHRCNDSEYFFGESIELNKVEGQYNISFVFDNHRRLLIGLKKEKNPEYLEERKLDDNVDSESVWIKKFHFDYSTITDISEISEFIESIKNRLCTDDGIFKDF